MARTSPNSRLSFSQLSPPSRLRKSCPKLVETKTTCGAAPCVATHHGVLFSSPGSLASCQVSPASTLRRSLPVEPGGPFPLVRKIALPSGRGTIARVYCQLESSGLKTHDAPSSKLQCSPLLVVANSLRRPSGRTARP